MLIVDLLWPSKWFLALCKRLSVVFVTVAEFAALKDECAHLRQRILDIENEMKKYVVFRTLCSAEKAGSLCLPCRVPCGLFVGRMLLRNKCRLSTVSLLLAKVFRNIQLKFCGLRGHTRIYSCTKVEVCIPMGKFDMEKMGMGDEL